MEVWQDSIELCDSVYSLTNKGDFAKDFALRDQIRKSAISVPSNIAESFERESPRQFLYFLVIAKGSCGELRTQLKIAEKLNYISNTAYSEYSEKCEKVSRQIKGLSKYLSDKIKK